MLKKKTFLGGALAAGTMAMAAAFVPTGSASAAMEVIVIDVDPANTATCMELVEDLKNEAKNTASTPFVVAAVEEATEACNAEDYKRAENALVDGWRWLHKNQMRQL